MRKEDAPTQKLPPVLTIAGSDSSGGAGIQADLKAFTALGTYGMSVITALTAQNTFGVAEILPIPPAFVEAQLRAVWSDIPPRAVKLGMLANAQIIEVVGRFLRGVSVPWVLDPVLIATSGARLLDPDAEAALRALCAEATVVTPNLPEAAALAQHPLPTTEKEAYELGHTLSLRYPHPVWLLKGGHSTWEPHTVTSWIFYSGELLQKQVQPRLSLPRPPHGSGCTLAAALAAYLAWGEALPVAMLSALDFVHRALAKADLTLGGAAVVPNPYAAACAPS